MEILKFNNTHELEDQILHSIERNLIGEINSYKRATLLLSGGGTPMILYSKFKSLKIDWNKVSISTTDERFVSIKSKDSNFLSINKSINNPSIKISSMIFDNKNLNNNVKECNKHLTQFLERKSFTLLGMGEDGHFASLFPNQKISSDMYETNKSKIISNIAPNEPRIRISHNLRSILNSNKIILYITGEKKLNIIKNHQLNLPIHQLTSVCNHLVVYWTA